MADMPLAKQLDPVGGDVGVEKEREKEEKKGEKMENFFCSIYEFLT